MGVRNAQPCLQALEHLLCGLGDTFNACGLARLGGVVSQRLLQALLSDLLGVLSRDFDTRLTKQTPDARDHPHGCGVQNGLRNGSSGGGAKAGLAQRLALLHLTSKVGCRELTSRGQTRSAQASDGGGSARHGQRSSGGTSGQRSGHVRHRPAQQLFELGERRFGPALFGGLKDLTRTLLGRLVLGLCLGLILEAHLAQQCRDPST